MPFKIQVWDIKRKVMHKWDKEEDMSHEDELLCINSIYQYGTIQFINGDMMFTDDLDRTKLRYFTGKIDVHKCEVYTEDIIYGLYEKRTVIGIVRWFDEFYGFGLEILTKSEPVKNVTLSQIDTCLVMGNIYQDHSLIEDLND